jgi:hypothetical protein
LFEREKFYVKFVFFPAWKFRQGCKNEQK